MYGNSTKGRRSKPCGWATGKPSASGPARRVGALRPPPRPGRADQPGRGITPEIVQLIESYLKTARSESKTWPIHAAPPRGEERPVCCGHPLAAVRLI